MTEPLKIFSKLYGANLHLVKLLSLRTEIFNFNSIAPEDMQDFFDILTNYIPIKIGFRPLYIIDLMRLEYNNSYRTYRHLFNLPVNGQKTWGGGKTIKNMKSQLYNFKLKKFQKFFHLNNNSFMAETVNLLWKQQWRHEWEISKKYRERLPWYVQRKKKWLNISAMVSRRIESFFKHPYRFRKKKHHRKKKKINKHVITAGFDFGFSMNLLKNISF